jgi:PAS domain S-box-containing protein
MPTALNDTSMEPPSAAEPEAARRGGAWRSARLQICIILTLGACVTALLWLIMIVVINNERQAAIRHARSEADNLSAAFQSEIGQTMDSLAQVMTTIADRMRAAGGSVELRDLADQTRSRSPATLLAAIIGPDGKLQSSTLDVDVAGIDLSDREHFRIHLDGKFKGPFVSEPLVGRVSGQAVLQISQRVEAADGKFLGVVVVSLAPGRLTALHKSIDLGQRGMLIVLGTRDNAIRARFGADNENTNLADGEWVPPPLAHTADNSTAQNYIRVSAIDQVARLYSARYVPGYPLRVVVALDLTEALQPAEAHLRLIVAIGILATLMLGCLMKLLVAEIRRRTDREVKLGDEQARLAAEIQQGSEIQKRLRSSEARLRDFAETASDWFWEQDAELRFTDISIGTPLNIPGDRSRIGRRRWEVNDTSQAPEHWANHERDLMARRPFRDFRYSRPGADGKMRHVSITGVPVFDESGVFLGYRGTGRDITAKVEAEAELLLSKDQAEASNTAKSAFLANMSHELRTPLNAIIGFAELIHSRKSGRVTDEYVEWAGDIVSSGRHLLDLINNVLELSRIEAGRYDLADDTVDLSLLVRSCLPMVRRQAETNRVRIDYATGERAALVKADSRAIKQVVLNLLSNAVKFTPSGGTVSIRAESGLSGEISLVVADTGIGIDPAVLPDLCKPFVQADASTSRKFGGTGLGLAISSKLVALHGGAMTIESTLGEGTTVRVSFPVERVLTVRRHKAEVV